MKKTGTSIDIRTIKNFPSDNPNAKIVKDGLFLRVVEREYYWSKEKQRGLERRRYPAISLTISTTTPRPTRNTSNALVRVGLFL